MAVAAPCTLLGFCGRAALGRALREADPVYAASQWLCTAALLERARQLTSPAPPSYRNLSGNGGLELDDPVWQCLRGMKPVEGPAEEEGGEVEVAAAHADDDAAPASDVTLAAAGATPAAAAAAIASMQPPTLLFETSAMVLADTNPSCFSSEDGYSVMTW